MQMSAKYGHCFNTLHFLRAVLELGGGMTALCGLGIAAALKCAAVVLTDGHMDCVRNQVRVLRDFQSKASARLHPLRFIQNRHMHPACTSTCPITVLIHELQLLTSMCTNAGNMYPYEPTESFLSHPRGTRETTLMATR